MNNEKQVRSIRKKVRCPSCGRIMPYEGNPYRPFCSRGCKGLDLVHWATEGYRIEGKPEEDRVEDE
ncbi:MAG TPA: DNA gyrase inhibitor YacG [Deltaproteobacteria bacterium]|nr:DNA gyrase inhibitor YacG [Deltaproteobacteria bacterium]